MRFINVYYAREQPDFSLSRESEIN